MDIYTMMSQNMGFFFLVLMRISGIFVAAPIIGSRNFPVYGKAGLALILAYIIFPLVYSKQVVIADQLIAYILLVIGELMIGIMIGFVSTLVFSAIQTAGQLIDMQIGFGVVNVIDPLFGQQVPLVGNFKHFLALVVFLAMNGHHVLLTALFDSFKIIPVTGAVFSPVLTEFISNAVFAMLVTACKICLPIMAAALLTDIALGILARTMPQMNIFIVGVPGKIFIGLIVIMLVLPFYVLFLEVSFNGMYRDIYRLLETLR